MKKLYSFVLMATMLLIGTNVRADYEASWLQDQFDLVSADGQTHTITMEDDITLTDPVFLGTTSVDAVRKSIELDLNGHNIVMQGTGDLYFMFVVSHGELLVRNKAAQKSTIELKGTTLGNSAIFAVYGSYKSSRWMKDGDGNYVAQTDDSKIFNTRAANGGYFTHLEIGTGVELLATNCEGAGIIIDEIYGSTVAKDVLLANSVSYTTNLFNKGGNTGLAQGVRVDIKGDIDFRNTSGSKSYAVKANGMIETTLNEPPVSGNFKCDCEYKSHYDQNKAAHVLDTCDAPFVHIYSTAKVQSNPSGAADKSAGIYAAGYVKWLIEGYCSGNTALNSKSGDVVVHDAVLESTYIGAYTAPQGGTGATGAGSAVVLNSTQGYAGHIDIKITGDTKVSAESGYAIEETISSGTSSLDYITIESGTIEGGAQGAVGVTEDGATKTSVYGATLDTKGDNVVTVDGQPQTVQTLVGNTEEVHVTPVTVNGHTTYVVSEGANGPEEKTSWADVVSAGSGNWTEIGESGVTVTLSDDVTLSGELQMISGDASHLQTIIIPDQKKLQVKNLVMNDYARIIVRAGGKLIVTGEQGIVGGKVENILLQNEEDKPAIFLFNPAVTSNRHPKATVEFTSKGYNKGGSNFGWQKFGVPTQTGELAGISIEGDIATAFGKFNYAAATPAWEVIGHLNHTPALNLADLNQSFEYYQMLHNTATIGTKVTFTGRLVGNDCPAPVIRPNFWNGYANSYSAPINAEALFAQIPAPADKAFYLYKQDNITKEFSWVGQSMVLHSDIQPMQPFLIRNPKADATALALNYGAAVYTPATATNNAPGAPARHANDMDRVELIVRGTNGVDHVVVAQGDQFSAEFDNGYDVAKYMNDEVNMYVSADEKMAIYASDDLENTYLGFQTVKGGNYTIEFANVQGEELTLIDLDNNASVVMVEGNKYEFTADANSNNDYRFKIVSTFNAPTAIENTEAAKSAKGIYTITGQYVGEMNVWNSLPAGIYVIDGAKRVK